MSQSLFKLKNLQLLVLAALSLTSSAVSALPGYAFEYRHPMVMGAVTPVPGDNSEGGGSASAPTTLTMAESTLPEADVGVYYDFDFNTLLTIGGDDPPVSNAISWAIQGLSGYPVEAGPSITSGGVLNWTPSSKGIANFEVVATHQDVEGRQVFTLRVNGLEMRVTQITAGGNFTCALSTAGGVKCWGANAQGQLGDGTTTDRTSPADVTGLTSGVARIYAGASHMCALLNSGGVKCWGANAQGQLGDGTMESRTLPVDTVGLSSGVSRIALGQTHSCALMTAGGVKCWGANALGQLGDGTDTRRITPVDVSGLSSGVADIVADTYHTCALTAAGGVKCWGYNSGGQLGDGSVTNRRSPVDVSGLASGVVSIAAGSQHNCAVIDSGAARCWGYNGTGQLGDGSKTQRRTPVEVSGLSSGVARVDAGANHSCAITTAGGVKCWGYNAIGQIGDGTVTERLTPVNVQGLSSGVGAISAGTFHTCVQLLSGEAKCWGGNGYGQLGNGTTTSGLTPVDVLR